jgi:hypothetical protein
MVALGAVPAIFLAVLMPRCPESSRQLVSHGRFEEAGRALGKIFLMPVRRRLLVRFGLLKLLLRRGCFYFGEEFEVAVWEAVPCSC